MDPEKLMLINYEDIMKFLEKALGLDKLTVIVKHLNKAFPSWNDLWATIRKWLLTEHPLTNMQRSFHSFAQLFPDYEMFAKHLDNSLSINEDFWNQVYYRLCAAQKVLKC